MATTGRRAAEGDRYPSGKLKQPAKFAGISPAQIRKVTDLAKAKAADPILATSVGWLHLHGKLTNLQLSSAASYATLRGKFHRAMGFSPRTAASPSYEQGYGSFGGPEDERRVLRIREDHSGLLKLFKPAEIQFLDRICIDDQMPGSWEVERLVEHLLTIAKHFRLS